MELVTSLTVFVLAVFVGFEVITKVPPTLHTPLMSGSNAISGITLVGALLSASAGHDTLTTVLGFLAVVFATINVVGGFLVTHRMLAMFREEEIVSDVLVNLAYLVAATLFIFGLKGLTHPRTAVRGNAMGSIGMLIAVVVTLTDQGIVRWDVLLAGLVVGGLIGAVLAVKIEMTSMPELVAIFNGFGGIASVLVAGGALILEVAERTPGPQMTVATAASGLIGAVTFTGSLVAFGKLKGIVSGAPLMFPGQQLFNGLLAVGMLGCSVMLVLSPEMTIYYWIVVGIASLLGILLVIPVGGADMPVVIALLNSYSGLAAAATGFVLSNNILIIAGSLVGASGLILTSIMCKAMNRSLGNVMFAGVGAEVTDGPSADDVYAGKIKATSAEEIAMLLDGISRVVIVPGYGMAVAQAQHAVRDFTKALQ